MKTFNNFFFRHIQYNDLSNRVYGWSMDDAPKEHKKKTTLLMYFAQYMDEHLIHGGDMLVRKEERLCLHPAIFMKKWFRTGRAIVMYLNNGTLQVGTALRFILQMVDTNLRRGTRCKLVKKKQNFQNSVFI